MGEIFIEILGHKAKVAGIRGRLKDGIWRKEDYLDVWFEFEEAVDSTLGFGIELPVANYGKEEFLALIKREGEAGLKEIIKRDAEKREKQKSEGKRQEDLDSLASQIKGMITK